MDDILASIRRILDEDGAAKPPSEDVLMLDASMMVDEPAAAVPAPPTPAPPAPTPPPENTPAMSLQPDDRPAPAVSVPRTAGPAETGAEAAAASSVGALMRTLAAERKATVSRGGVTIEDIVREEVRTLLSAWLDTHLPPIVERAVQVEIERIVGRQAG